MKIGFIGFGRMGGALANGAIAAHAVSKSQLAVFDTDKTQLVSAKKNRILVAGTLQDLVGSSDYIFLCVKPQGMGALLKEIASSHSHSTLQKKCFVSIAAGITVERIEKVLGRNVSVLRVMPNTPALLLAGMSGLSRGHAANKNQVRVVENILKSVGKTLPVSETQMHAVTAVSGSGPAYVFYLAEAMIEAAQKLGFTTADAKTLVHQTVYGAGLMLKDSDHAASELRRHVTSPGGTTEAALQIFEKRGFKRTVKEALQNAVKRSKFLSKIF